MSTVEHSVILQLSEAQYGMIQFYPSLVLKALFSHQWNIPAYTKVKVVSQHILTLEF